MALNYAIVKVLDCSFEDAIARIQETAPAHQLGVVYDVDVQKTIQNKLGENFRPYRILGLCNPAIARAAIEQDADFGALLPCAVAVQAEGEDRTRLSFYNLPAIVPLLDNPALTDWKDQVTAKLQAFADAL